MNTSKPSMVRAIATDAQFWIPVAVLAIGVAVLVMVK